jgi:hypothetical protein
MKVRNLLYSPTAIPTGKSPRFLLHMMLGGHQSWSRIGDRGKVLLLLLATDPPSSSLVASPVLITCKLYQIMCFILDARIYLHFLIS